LNRFDVIDPTLMPMYDVIIVSTISRMLRAVAVVVILILNVRW